MPLSSRGRLTAVLSTLASSALLAATLTAAPAPATAAPGSTDTVRTFDATVSTTGAIPDGPDTGGTCATNFPAIKEVLIPVSGMTGPITDVRITVGLEHDKIGDIGLALEAPDGTRAGIINRIGADRVQCGDDSGFNGSYAFFDGAVGNMAAIAASVDSTRDLGSGGYFPSTASGQVIPLTSPFAKTNPNGTWKLFVADYQAGVVGRVYSASLRLATANKAASPQCATANATLTKATSEYAKAKRKFNDARHALQRARRVGPRKNIGFLAQTFYRKKAVKGNAKRNLQAAGQQKIAACGS